MLLIVRLTGRRRVCVNNATQSSISGGVFDLGCLSTNTAVSRARFTTIVLLSFSFSEIFSDSCCVICEFVYYFTFLFLLDLDPTCTLYCILFLVLCA